MFLVKNSLVKKGSVRRCVVVMQQPIWYRHLRILHRTNLITNSYWNLMSWWKESRKSVREFLYHSVIVLLLGVTFFSLLDPSDMAYFELGTLAVLVAVPRTSVSSHLSIGIPIHFFLWDSSLKNFLCIYNFFRSCSCHLIPFDFNSLIIRSWRLQIVSLCSKMKHVFLRFQIK
jgi:hypothetical protein